MLGAATVASNPTSLDARDGELIVAGSRFGSGAIEPAAARNASRISSALFHRSALSNESALSITLAIAAGTSGATLVTARAFFVAAATSSCDAFTPSCTFSPASSANIVAPTAHKSVCASMRVDSASACSGAMNAGVPSIVPAAVAVASEACSSCSRAIPKSSTSSRPSLVMNKFAGFRSR